MVNKIFLSLAVVLTMSIVIIIDEVREWESLQQVLKQPIRNCSEVKDKERKIKRLIDEYEYKNKRFHEILLSHQKVNNESYQIFCIDEIQKNNEIRKLKLEELEKEASKIIAEIAKNESQLPSIMQPSSITGTIAKLTRAKGFDCYGIGYGNYRWINSYVSDDHRLAINYECYYKKYSIEIDTYTKSYKVNTYYLSSE